MAKRIKKITQTKRESLDKRREIKKDLMNLCRRHGITLSSKSSDPIEIRGRGYVERAVEIDRDGFHQEYVAQTRANYTANNNYREVDN